MMTAGIASRSWTATGVATITILLLGMLVGVATSAETDRDRLDRKVRVMERVLDEVLAQSPHAAVHIGQTSRGLVLDDYGVVFTMDLSLANELLASRYRQLGGLVVGGNEEGERRYVDLRADLTKHRKEQEQEVKKRRAGVQRELTDALIDYGITLNELTDDHWVVIAVFVNGLSEPFVKSSQRLVLKIKMQDLRKHATGALSREAITKAVVVEQS